MKETEIFYVILSAKDRPFADERDKKKLLDLVAEVKGQEDLDIFAFCVTDEEGHFLVSGQSDQKLKLASEGLIRGLSFYYKKERQEPKGGFTKRMKFRKFMTEDEILESCLKMHLIPMEQKLARNPEDYWWCSYVDYRKYHRKGIVDTDMLLQYLDSDQKRAIRKFISLHHNSL